MIVYIVHGDIIYDGEYYEGVFSTLEQAENHAKNLPDYYDNVTVRESKIDDPAHEGNKWDFR